MEQTEKQVNQLQQSRAGLSQELQQTTDKLDQLEKTKDGLLLQKDAAENSKSVASISKFYQTEQTRLQVHAAQTA